jgi:hypothetical protein
MRPRLRLALVLLLVAGLVLLGARALHRRDLGDRLMRADPESVLADPRWPVSRWSRARPVSQPIAPPAMAPARATYARHPDLTDGDTLYGEGQVSEIEADCAAWHPLGRSARLGSGRYARLFASEPYAREPIPPLTPAQITDVTQYLLRLHGRAQRCRRCRAWAGAVQDQWRLLGLPRQ